MSKVVIKKKIGLSFLGEDYKDAYFIFRSISLGEYKKLTGAIPTINPEFTALVAKIESGQAKEEDMGRFVVLQKENSAVNDESYEVILKTLKEHFLSGEFPSESGTLQKLEKSDADEMDNIDKETLVICFKTITGETLDPKVLVQ